jgi:hypothetical protein
MGTGAASYESGDFGTSPFFAQLKGKPRPAGTCLAVLALAKHKGTSRLLVGGRKYALTEGSTQSCGMAVEVACPRNILFLLRRHFRRIRSARHTARPEVSAGDVVFG